VSRYQKSETNLDFTEAIDSEWQWDQLGHMQVCTSLQTDNHASTPTTQFFTGRMPLLPANQQRQSTEGKTIPRPYQLVSKLKQVNYSRSLRQLDNTVHITMHKYDTKYERTCTQKLSKDIAKLLHVHSSTVLES